MPSIKYTGINWYYWKLDVNCKNHYFLLSSERNMAETKCKAFLLVDEAQSIVTFRLHALRYVEKVKWFLNKGIWPGIYLLTHFFLSFLNTLSNPYDCDGGWGWKSFVVGCGGCVQSINHNIWSIGNWKGGGQSHRGQDKADGSHIPYGRTLNAQWGQFNAVGW